MFRQWRERSTNYFNTSLTFLQQFPILLRISPDYSVNTSRSGPATVPVQESRFNYEFKLLSVSVVEFYCVINLKATKLFNKVKTGVPLDSPGCSANGYEYGNIACVTEIRPGLRESRQDVVAGVIRRGHIAAAIIKCAGTCL